MGTVAPFDDDDDDDDEDDDDDDDDDDGFNGIIRCGAKAAVVGRASSAVQKN